MKMEPLQGTHSVAGIAKQKGHKIKPLQGEQQKKNKQKTKQWNTHKTVTGRANKKNVAWRAKTKTYKRYRESKTKRIMKIKIIKLIYKSKAVTGKTKKTWNRYMDSKTKINNKKHKTVTGKEKHQKRKQHKTVTGRAKQTTKNITPLQGEHKKRHNPVRGEQQQIM